jgi:hypothetical protein
MARDVSRIVIYSRSHIGVIYLKTRSLSNGLKRRFSSPILTPGPRVSPYSGQVIAYTNGVPSDIGPLGAVLSRLGQSQAGRVE